MSTDVASSTQVDAKKVLERSIVWLALGCVVLGVTGTVTYLAWLNGHIDDRMQRYEPVPIGAVMAFNLAECPDGWGPFDKAKGRFLVGVDERSVSGPTFHLMEEGGTALSQLTVRELPAHSHEASDGNYVNYAGGASKKPHALFESGGVAGSLHEKTEMAGDGEPFPNLPPFIALRFCVKMGKSAKAG